MDMLRFTVLVAFVGLASSAIAQPLDQSDAKAPQAEAVTIFRNHTSEVMALAFNSDGSRIVSVSTTGDVRFWHSDSGKEIASHELAWTPSEYRPTVFAVGPVSSEGSPVALVQYKLRESKRRGFFASAVLYSPTGEKATTFDVQDERQIDDPERGGFWAYVVNMVYSADGKRLVTSGTSWLVGGRHGLHGGEVKIWDVETGKLIRQLGETREGEVEQDLPPHALVKNGVSTSSNAGALAVSTDGKYVAVGTDGAGGELPESGEVWIWESESGKTVNILTTKEDVPQGEWKSAVSAVALSNDNKYVAASIGGRPPRRDGLVLGSGPAAELRIWEVASGRQIHILRGHKGSVAQLAFSPDGKLLASAGSDQTVRLWDAGKGKIVSTLPFDTPQINALTFSPDGKLLAAGGGNGKKSGEVRVWACPMD